MASKASEWAEAHAARPVWISGAGEYDAKVTETGWCAIRQFSTTVSMKPENALALAAWIIATFGEQP